MLKKLISNYRNRTLFILIASAAITLCTPAYAQEEKILRWSSAGDFLTFDVHAQNESLNSAANAAVYESLVRYNPDMKVEPALATHYERVKDGFLFTIRQGVRFHEGEILTAEDVAYSINRALRPEIQFKVAAAGFLNAPVVNDKQVLIKTTSGSPVFLNQLTQLSWHGTPMGPVPLSSLTVKLMSERNLSLTMIGGMRLTAMATLKK